ncbi:MAG: tRNA (guanine(10)-N(2))-dimethyltransferase [Nanoarchaeota archaeon]|nr:tRNA (guanine(10)-N(2))-dimethyltransferase [Nanoarchaeota archaeon]
MLKYEITTEGTTKLYVSLGKISKKLPVFYNPAKKFDRDISVLFLRTTRKKKVLDLLAASGARGLRLAKEANAKVWFNDINKEAVKLIKKNVKLNNIKPLGISNKRADEFLVTTKEKFDFIDIDPFGSPITYVYQAIPRLAKDGTLAVTATDTAPLFGVYPWTCFRKYGSFSLKTKFSHEIGVRILAKAVIEIAAKHNISLKPIFAHATQHYYRIYFQSRRSHLKEVLQDIGFIYYCSKCKKRFATKFEMHEKCKCGNKLSFAGPLYIGNLWNTKLIEKMLSLNSPRYIKKLKKKHEKFLNRLLEESKVNIPYYYEAEELGWEGKKLDEIVKYLRKKGFKSSRTHFSGKGVRTEYNVK